MMIGQTEVGRRVRELRHQLGLAQRDLAGDGVSASYVSLIESGRRVPTARAVEAIAGRLGVEAEFLVSGTTADNLVQGRTDLALARLALHEGRAEDATQVLTRLVAGGTAGGADVLWQARLELGTALERTGRLHDAIAVLEGLREQGEQDPAAAPVLPLLVSLARCYRESGDTAHAIELAERGLASCARMGLHAVDGHVALTSTLAGLYAERGDLHKAGRILDELIHATDKTGTGLDRSYAYWSAALNAAELGDRGEALRLVERAASLISEHDDDRNAARLRVSRAWILLAQDPPDAEVARALLVGVLPALRQHAGNVSVASALVELGRAETILGDTDSAAERAHDALALTAADEHPLVRARAHIVVGVARLDQGRHDAGRAELGAAAVLLEDAGSARQAAAAWRQLADAYELAGDVGFALQAAGRALDAVGVVRQQAAPVYLP